MFKRFSRRSACCCYARGVVATLVRYRSPDEDSGRWLAFSLRPGDIVISTRRRSGTTWTQMICALLIFQTPDLPAPLSELSPWLDHLVRPPEFVYGLLAEQQHRRFIKTHTPLDGIPADPRVTYIVTARHPLDMFVSLRVQLDNFPAPGARPRTAESIHDNLVGWIADAHHSGVYPESLAGVMRHLSDAWARRGEPNVILVHYDDLCADLGGQMRWLAGRLGITVPEQTWPALVEAATFESMRGRAEEFAPPPGTPPPGAPPPGGPPQGGPPPGGPPPGGPPPGGPPPGGPALGAPPPGPHPAGTVSDAAAFFSRGSSGAAREILSDEEMAGYYARAAQLAPPDMLEWLHR
jgi:aryl sulfotransferase